ncbi:MAG: hypothetical protein [Microviridae sp.]|nr:MAG: hypothetical protein [Microviridae sp.]
MMIKFFVVKQKIKAARAAVRSEERTLRCVMRRRSVATIKHAHRVREICSEGVPVLCPKGLPLTTERSPLVDVIRPNIRPP